MRSHGFAALGLLGCLLVVTAEGADDIAGDVYAVGVAEVDITPDHPIRLNGFGFRRTESEGVEHRIHARALAIRHGDGPPVVLMTVDVLGIPEHHRAELAKRLQAKAKLPPERLAITATHTHTGPMLQGANVTLFGVPIPDDHLDHIAKYTRVFLDRLEEAALTALKEMKPAKLTWGVGRVGFAKNRRKGGGPSDHDLPVLIVRDAKTNAVRAVYTSYACHCVTLSHNRIGGDWAGFAAEAIAAAFPGAIGLVSIGCGADQNPDTGVTGGKVDAAKAQGRMIADEVKRLAAGWLAPVRGAPVCTMKTLDLPLANLPERAVWEEKAKLENAIGHHARVQLARLDRKEPLRTSIPYPVQTWTFGDGLALVHLAGEVVVDYSLRLKKELDRGRVWITAYANTNPCYIPSERVLKEGGYEGGGAMIYYDVPVPFKPGLEESIVRAVRGQLGERFRATVDSEKTGGSAPQSPQQSQTLIRVGERFAVDLVVAEPLVADPVALGFGPDGALWVAEMLDYPSGPGGKYEPGGRIRRLVDSDGDGRFDRATVFLDGLPFPTGVLPWRGGLLICAAPDIVFAEDTTGDGKADRVEKLFSGFGTENYQARVNSLVYGLDGWVYGSCGLFGGNILSHRTGKTLALGHRDFRIRPDTGAIEPATGRTQQGRVRNDAGQWFGCDNTHLGWHYPLTDHELRRNPFVVPPAPLVNLATGPDASRLFPIRTLQLFKLSGPAGGVTAACGIGFYRDNLLGGDLTGNLFTCEPVNLLVHRRVLRPSGSTFTGVRADDEAEREFFASADLWCRPVQAITGPDGGLWIADMYRFVIEHPRWIPPADLASLDLRAGAGLGRIYRVRPKVTPLRPWTRLDRLDTAGLVAALDSANGWQRDQVTELLAWRADRSAVPLLIQQLKQAKRAETRLHALAAIERLGALDAGLVKIGLSDPHPLVRGQAARQAEAYLDGEATLGPALVGLVDDPDGQVRLQVASTLGAWKDARAGAGLARLAQGEKADAYLVAAVVSGLNRGNFHAVVERLDVGKLAGSSLLPQLITTAIGLGEDTAMTALLARVGRPVDGKYQAWQFTATETVLDAWARLAKGKPRPAIVAEVVANARRLVGSASADPATRSAAVRLLGREPAHRKEDLAALAALLVPQTPTGVQSAAIAALGRIADEKVVEALLIGWKGYTPALQAQVAEALFARPAWLDRVLTALADKRLPVAAVTAPRRHRLLTHTDPAIRARAEKLFAGATSANRQEVIDRYRKELRQPGDAMRGKLVFAKTCAACHHLEGVGNKIGPDLAALANKSAEYLLAEILDPNRNLDSRYVEYLATTSDGRTFSGLLASETSVGITLLKADGKESALLRADLEELTSSGRSLMPEGLEKDLPPASLADLLAYLASVGRR